MNPACRSSAANADSATVTICNRALPAARSARTRPGITYPSGRSGARRTAWSVATPEASGPRTSRPAVGVPLTPFWEKVNHVSVGPGYPSSRAAYNESSYDDSLYAARLEGYPGPTDTWFTFSQNGVSGTPTAGLLVRGPDASGVATLHAVRRAPDLPLGYVMPGLVRALR